MPIWITLLISLITNLPAIIKLIREIFGMLDNASPDVRRSVSQEVRDALQECRNSRECGSDPDHKRLVEKLQGVLDSLKP